jgi:2-keto-4-pentenoate hydratase/2-oxohepta-3-ene-1,7-dioic acid hydratase in catechol pathway
MHFLVKQGVATTMVVQTRTERLLFSTSPGSTVRRGSLLDFEVELVIVIGKRAKRVPEEAALAHVRDEVEPICECKCAVIGPLKRY